MATVETVATRRPAMISGHRERQLHPPEQLALRHPHPAAGVLGRGGHVREPGVELR